MFIRNGVDMDEAQCKIIAQSLLAVTGVELNVTSKRINGLRSSLVACFTGYGIQEGPRFAIKAHGLKSHQITATMGTFAAPCIRLMQAAAPDKIDFAHCLIRHLANQPNTKVTIAPNQSIEEWKIQDSSFSIKIVTRVNGDQYSDHDVAVTATKFMAPLVAAFAEIIGYTESNDTTESTEENTAFDIEGQLTLAITKKRERSRRNRMLCLAIHGNRCYVCGINPDSLYNTASGIIEVHHIEPISIQLKPRIYNPRTDLIPLCPNCHRAIHRKFPAMLPADLRADLIKPYERIINKV